MKRSTAWSPVERTCIRAVSVAALCFAIPAFAVGTIAGTTISNTATATYTDGGGNPVAVPSNPVAIRVDELLDVTVALASPGDVPVAPGATNQALGFTITNTGNGPEAFDLSAITAILGDAFDPSATSIVRDTAGDGIYDSLTDPLYVAANNILAPDASMRVIVLSSIPGTATDAQRGQLGLFAAAVTGTGAPGTAFAGAGTSGSDAIVGSSGADGRDDGFYAVTAATVALVKSATVLGPLFGTRPLPGAIITYTLVATVSGSGSIPALAVGDPIPAGTTYEANSLTLQGAPLTDAADADAGERNATGIAARFATVAAGQTRTVTFQVKID